MKWYIASRFKHRDKVRSIIKSLENKGHTFVYDWTNIEDLSPFRENSERCKKIAEEISSALRDVDVFILISDSGGTDMFIELGIVISNWITKKNIRIYVVGKHNKRSLMQLHPAVIHVDSIKDVFSKEKLDISVDSI